MAKTAIISAEDRQFNKNKWLFSISGVGRDLSYQLVTAFLLTYIQFGVNLTVAQFATVSLLIGVLGRIWDAINDPVMGAIIEGSRLKWGKFKPWIFIGAVCTGVVILLMFNVQSLGGWAFVAFITAMYLLWETSYTMNDIGYWSMLPALTSKQDQRNQASMLTVLFAGIGAIIAQGVIPTLTTGNMLAGYRLVSIIAVVGLVSMQCIMAVFIKERPRAEMQQEASVSLKSIFVTIKNNDQLLWVTLSHILYSIGSALLTALAANLVYAEIAYNGDYYFYMVVAYGVPSVLVNVMYPKIVAKLGRKKLQRLAIAVAVVGYVGLGCVGWTGTNPVLTIALFCAFAVIISCGQSLFYMANIVHMTNCVEYNEYKQGQRNEAIVSTLRPFTAKLSSALQTVVVTVVLVASGIYGISGNITGLETQKNLFDKMYTTSSSYTTDVGNYLDEVNNYILLVEQAQGDEQALQQISKQLETSKYQFSVDSLVAVGDAVVAEKYQTPQNGNTGYAICRLKDFDKSMLEEGKQYTLIVGDLNGYELSQALQDDSQSAADKHFHGQVNANLGARIGLRLAVTLVPIVLMLLALFIVDKKFIIDEQYYEHMMQELETRHA